MNLRIGAFGRQEAMSAVWICAFASGCFAFDNRALFWDGNASYPEHALAAALAALLFVCAVSAIRKRGGRDLSALIGASKGKAGIAALLILSLLLSAIQPQQQFLLTLTQYVFVDAKQVSICFYLLPCITLLSALGAETLVRTARMLLPLLCLSVLAALALNCGQARLSRLYPVPIGKPVKLLTDTATALHRAFSPLLALLCIGEGTQNVRTLKSAGTLGALFGAATVVAMLFGLSCCFSYGMLSEMPAPFYRMLVEARTENPTLRFDRVTLFLWMACSLLASAIYVYAAGVLFCKTFGVRDIRPVACLFGAICAAAILALYYDSEPTMRVLKLLYRFGWTAAVVPLPLLCMTGKERPLCGACS
ncbi:MAG: GerAB/ArcD/ProY family transporter [Clostridia bacterium]|nr:GerAB/ArcD/ProY family transporter [Clostridia bacterium]